MGVFEDVILNAKVAMEAVGKKAGDMVDVSKLKVSAAEISREITHQMEEIGRLVYNSKKAGTDASEDIAKLSAEIDALYEQLTAVNGDILSGGYLHFVSRYCNRSRRTDLEGMSAMETVKYTLEDYREAAETVKERIGTADTAVVLGSGLGKWAERLEDVSEIPYSEIPHFPVSTVASHAGKLISGTWHGKRILCMSVCIIMKVIPSRRWLSRSGLLNFSE